MLNKYSVSGKTRIKCTFCISQSVIFTCFYRNETFKMNIKNTAISLIGNYPYIFSYIAAIAFKQPEIMSFSFWKSNAHNVFAFFVSCNLNFYCVPFFLARVVLLLFFWGRSISISVASTTTFSIVLSSSSFFLDGKWNALFLISVSSAHVIA